MSTNIYDVGVIGLGVAGAFSIYKISKENKNTKIIGFDIGRAPQKRKQQLLGWMGSLPGSDGKLYQHDISKISEITGLRKAKSATTIVNKILKNINDFEIINDKPLNAYVEKRLNKFDYKYFTNDYMQMYPKDIHDLSKYISSSIEDNKNISFNFDTEIESIYKQKNIFVLNDSDGREFKCKKLIIAVGRSGWRWCKDLFIKFGIIDNNDIARYGIRIESNSNIMKDFLKSNCTITKGNELEIGPLSWFGTVIPEDHFDVAISAFRSNENRWKSDKVSFLLIGNRYHKNYGCEQTDRISKLTFLLANDRIMKEKVSLLLNNKSKISVLPDYDWLKNVILDLLNIIPDISKAYFHSPSIVTLPPKINIGNNLETEIDNMYVVGESAGIIGILSAMITGIIVSESVTK